MSWRKFSRVILPWASITQINIAGEISRVFYLAHSETLKNVAFSAGILFKNHLPLLYSILAEYKKKRVARFERMIGLPIGAFDIGGTKTLVGIVDEAGQILSHRRFATQTDSYVAHFERCTAQLKECLDELRLDMEALYGLGINMPGMVDARRGVLYKAVFAGWQDIDVRTYFRKATGLDRVFVDNDVNACAIGEMRFGYKDQYSDFVWMTVSTGVGGAVVAGGQLVRGHKNCAGEFGHMKVEYDHPHVCPCGEFGCMEAECSGSAITRMTLEVAEENPHFKALFAEKNLRVDAAGCASLARAGNAEAKAIFDRAAVYLGRGLANLINALNSRAAIIGGGVSASLDLMIDRIYETVNACVIKNLTDVDIVVTKLGYEAALIGAAALTLE